MARMAPPAHAIVAAIAAFKPDDRAPPTRATNLPPPPGHPQTA